jgi:hypothetical protein
VGPYRAMTSRPGQELRSGSPARNRRVQSEQKTTSTAANRVHFTSSATVNRSPNDLETGLLLSRSSSLLQTITRSLAAHPRFASGRTGIRAEAAMPMRVRSPSPTGWLSRAIDCRGSTYSHCGLRSWTSGSGSILPHVFAAAATSHVGRTLTSYRNCYVDIVAGVRLHSIVASAINAMVTANRPITIIHSTDPSCWSGSHPDTNSIQSGKIGVIRANTPVMAAKAISIQNKRRKFLRI